MFFPYYLYIFICNNMLYLYLWKTLIDLKMKLKKKYLSLFQGHTNTKGIPLEVSFSPDSMFVFSGSTDGRVHCWSTDTGARIATMSCDHPGPVQCVGFNPKYMMLATACTNMVSLMVHVL